MQWLDEFSGVLKDEPLSKHSQYGVGGPADWYIKLTDPKVMAELASRCSGSGIPVTVMGAGSNSLILDGGIRGLVVQYEAKQMREIDESTIELSAGYMLPRAAYDCAAHGISGMEFGIGIPGTCGASVVGNAGAFGTSIADVMVDCDVIDGQGKPETLNVEQCRFSYRTSVFKNDRKGEVVLAARFRVGRDDPQAIRDRTDQINRQRKESQPYGIRSLGSTFKNPTGDFAGRLIEAAGLKGKRIGGAEISPKHANFITNVDGAKAADVLALVRLAHDTVSEKFGVDLQPEIVVMGEDR